MRPAFDLEQLGPFGFQDLAGALAVEIFGPGVQAMGPGRDGGRDHYHQGPLIWKKTDDQEGEVWDGYTVFQVKHKDRLASRPGDNASWFWGQIRAELNEWADPTSDRDPVPNYLIFITNVPLSPTPGSGGHDQINLNIRKFITDLADSSRDVGDASERRAKLARMRRLRDWRIWDGNQIRTLLAKHDNIRRAFPGFFTAADVFANLAELSDTLPVNDLEPGLRAHARMALIGEGSIYFDEAGSGDATGFPVYDVVIDLPVTSENELEHGSAIRSVLDHGEHMLKPNMTVTPIPRHFIIAGAPGNGKTTISKFLVQAYRAAMLAGAEDLSEQHKKVISGTTAALKRIGSSLPKHRRWPIRIDLAEYVQEHGLREDSTLIRWISEKVSKRSNVGEIKPHALVSWMKQWPWFLILDGLDEVSEPTVRKRLIKQVTEFVSEAEADDCDVFVVLTTRPIGYTENIAPDQFKRIDLDYIEPTEAIRYGTLVTKVRLRSDLDRIERIVEQLNLAAKDESLRNLMRTPLQVLIMTIILGSAGRLAPDRFSLFWGYYETVFKRERDKPGGFHRILQEHGQQIRQLHEIIGFELQVRSESGERSSAILTHHELNQFTWQVLHDAGFKPSGQHADLLSSIVDAATKRLVLIAPHRDEGYGFDVRSLQELMAGMYLTSGPPEVVSELLRIAAPNPHWRNTWIFAAGHIFATPQEHRRHALVELVETIEKGASYRLGSLVPIGPRLALDLIDDGMARSMPKWRDRLISIGLKVLFEESPLDVIAIARVLVRCADSGDEERSLVAEGIRDALGGPPTARSTAERVQEHIAGVADDVGARAITRGLDKVRMHQNVGFQYESMSSWDDFEAEIRTFPGDELALEKAERAAEVIRGIRTHGYVDDVASEAIAAALRDEEAANALAAGLEHLAGSELDLVSMLRSNVLVSIYRAPIGDALRSILS